MDVSNKAGASTAAKKSQNLGISTNKSETDHNINPSSEDEKNFFKFKFPPEAISSMSLMPVK
jgi:hypothetical protein